MSFHSQNLTEVCEERRKSSVLRITAYQNPEQIELGTGVLVANELVLTAFHVIDKSTSIYGSYLNGEQLPLVLRDKDEPLDLAMLTITSKQYPAGKPVNISKTAGPGTKICAIGIPFGLPLSISYGEVLQVLSNGDFLLSKHFIYPGNSGGPLIDERGDMIGLSKSMLSLTEAGIDKNTITTEKSRISKTLGSMDGAGVGQTSTTIEEWLKSL